MSNAIVDMLDQTVERVAKAFGEDAGKAVEKLYKDSSGKLKDVIKNTVENDASKADDIKKILARMDKNAERTVAEDASQETKDAIKAEKERMQAKLHRDLAKALDPDSAEAEAKLRKTSTILGRQLRGGGEQQPAARWAAHHIVPEYHDIDGAEEARDALAKVDVPIIDKANGVWLPGSSAQAADEGFAGIPHSVIHTDTYGSAVAARLKALGPNATQADVTGELGNIKSEIQDGTFPH